MASPIEVRVPDIGGFKDVSVIDVLVKDGQQIDKETPLVTIETEKAAMDVPAPAAGKIAQVKLKTGDKVSEGSVILLLEPAAADAAPAEKAAAPAAAPSGAKAAPPAEDPRAAAATPSASPAAGAEGRGAQCGPGRGPGRRASILESSCQPFGAQVRARTGRGFGQGRRDRRQGPHHAG